MLDTVQLKSRVIEHDRSSLGVVEIELAAASCRAAQECS